MVFSSLIKILRQEKYYEAKRFLKEFPNRNWSITALNWLIAKIYVTRSAEKQYGGGRPCTARTMENVDSVETLTLSQGDWSGILRTIHQVSRETGISQTSVHHIIHKELKLKCLKKKQAQDLIDANKIARLVRTKQLLWKYRQRLVQFMWFTNEKLFTVTPPKWLGVHCSSNEKNKLQPIDCFILVQISLNRSWFQSWLHRAHLYQSRSQN